MPIDILLNDDGDITIPTRRAEGEKLVIQKVKIRSQTFRGEWLPDSREGIPWIKWLDSSEPPLTQIEDYLRSEYIRIAGVRKAEVTATFNELTYVVDIAVLIYLDDADAPSFKLTASIVPEEPAVLRNLSIAGIL